MSKQSKQSERVGHTKGPLVRQPEWDMDDSLAIGVGRYDSASILAWVTNPQGNAEANAALYIAAPTLLEACEAAKAFMGTLTAWSNSDIAQADKASEINEALAAAIALATKTEGGGM